MSIFGVKFKNIFTPCFCYNESSAQVIQHSENETGFDRVKRMYTKNEYNNVMSPEMFYLLQNATATVSISAFFGALIHAFKVRDDFMRKNVASTYESQYLAKRSLSDAITKSAIKGGIKYGFKYGSFSTLYLFSTMTIANYNDKITIWEHIGTGAALGGILRFNFGLKGMAAASTLGAVLGAFAGGILVLYMKLGNHTLKDIREWQSEIYYSARKEKSQMT